MVLLCIIFPIISSLNFLTSSTVFRTTLPTVTWNAFLFPSLKGQVMTGLAFLPFQRFVLTVSPHHSRLLSIKLTSISQFHSRSKKFRARRPSVCASVKVQNHTSSVAEMVINFTPDFSVIYGYFQLILYKPFLKLLFVISIPTNCWNNSH